MRKIKIFLIEDNRILRDGITAIINKQTDLKIVGATGGNHDTLLKAHKANPEVVLIDLSLRNKSGPRIVSELTKGLPRAKVIGMGLIPTQQDVVEFVQSGAAGFILKDATVSEFLGTIRAVVRGEKILPPILTGSLFAHVIELAIRNGKGDLAEAVRMTRREREIVSLIADGLSNKEIAQRLNIATYTVKSHVHNILEKLALQSRLEISAYIHNEETR